MDAASKPKRYRRDPPAHNPFAVQGNNNDGNGDNNSGNNNNGNNNDNNNNDGIISDHESILFGIIFGECLFVNEINNKMVNENELELELDLKCEFVNVDFENGNDYDCTCGDFYNGSLCPTTSQPIATPHTPPPTIVFNENSFEYGMYIFLVKTE